MLPCVPFAQGLYNRGRALRLVIAIEPGSAYQIRQKSLQISSQLPDIFTFCQLDQRVKLIVQLAFRANEFRSPDKRFKTAREQVFLLENDGLNIVLVKHLDGRNFF